MADKNELLRVLELPFGNNLSQKYAHNKKDIKEIFATFGSNLNCDL